MATGSGTDQPADVSSEAVGEGNIRRAFPLFVLAMWVCLGFLIADGQWSGLNTVLLIEAAVICSIVFRNFAYVFNYGYATSVIVLNATVLVVRGPDLAGALVCGLLIAYGVRLWLFTFLRYRSVAYADTRASLVDIDAQLPGFVKGFVYTQTVTLMTFHALTSCNVTSRGELSPWVIAGAALIALGIVVETGADLQKQRAKAAEPGRFVSTGLFGRTRHPNYLGEIVFQLGIIVAGVGAAAEWFGYLAQVLGPLYIIALMVTMVMRGERTKRARYRGTEGYAAYESRSGALFPRLRPAT
jgi:steroid 5-alpha reductase family enzyme